MTNNISYQDENSFWDKVDRQEATNLNLTSPVDDSSSEEHQANTDTPFDKDSSTKRDEDVGLILF